MILFPVSVQGDGEVLLNETFESLDNWDCILPEDYFAGIQNGCAHIWGDAGSQDENAIPKKPHISQIIFLNTGSSKLLLDIDFRARSSSSISYTTNAWITFSDPFTGHEIEIIWLAFGRMEDTEWFHRTAELTSILANYDRVEVQLGYSDPWSQDWDHEVWFDNLTIRSSPDTDNQCEDVGTRVIKSDDRMGLSVKWAFNTSNQFPGMYFGSGHQAAQTVFDIDEDGVNEIFFGTRRGDSKRLWCIDACGAIEWIYPPLHEDGLPGDPTSKVSLIDVDNDGILELSFAGRGGRLHILRGDGTVVWTWDNPNPGQPIYGPPQALDIDGDGFPEFFINCYLGFTHRLDHEGHLVWTSAQRGRYGGQPTIADMENDGEYELLLASQDNKVYCLSATTAHEKWSFDTGGFMYHGHVVVVDINGDGAYEALTWNDQPAGAVIIIDPKGNEITRWAHPRDGNIRLCQAFGDVDGDHSLDMAMMTSDAAFCVDIGTIPPTTKWEINFTQWSDLGYVPEGALSDHWSSYQLIADIDGDEELEVLWLAPFPIVTDGATGQLEAYYSNEFLAVNRRQENGGWWGDVDKDGISEWIVELNGNRHPDTMVYCLTMNGSYPARAAWPEYCHSALPPEEQISESLELVGSYSNSLWLRGLGVRIDRAIVSDLRCDIGSSQIVRFHALSEDTMQNAGGTIIDINGTSYTANATGWISFEVRSDSVARRRWIVTGVEYEGKTLFRMRMAPPEIVWDTIEVTLTGAGRTDVGTEGVSWQAIHVYDGTPFHGEVVLNDSDAKAMVGHYGYKVVEIADYVHGLTTFRSNEVGVIFDRVRLTIEPMRSRVDLGVFPQFAWEGHYEYDGRPFRGILHLNDSSPYYEVRRRGYCVNSISDPDYGLSAFEADMTSIIFDQVKVVLTLADDHIDTGSMAPLSVDARYEFDGLPFNGTVLLNNTVRTLARPGRLGYTAISIIDPQYDLTGLTSNSVACVWDKVNVLLRVTDNHIDVGTAASVVSDAKYEFSGEDFQGQVTLNNNLTQNEIGRFSFATASIEDHLFGLSAFDSNTVEVTYDTVWVDLNILDPRIDVGTAPMVISSGTYAYDGSPLKGWIALNDTPALSQTVCKKGYTTESVGDDRHGLETFRSNTVSCIFDRVIINITSPERADLNRNIEIVTSGRYEYDGKPFVGVAILNDTRPSSDTVIFRGYEVVAIIDALYGLMAFNSDTARTIFDQVLVVLQAADQRVNVGSEALILVSATYAYDGISFSGEVFLNETELSLSQPGRQVYTVAQVLDEMYGLEGYNSNSVEVVFDRVDVILKSPERRIQVGGAAIVENRAIYAYDGLEFSGVITLDNPTTINSLGPVVYSVLSVEDSVYGLEAFTSNQIELIFDSISIEQGFKNLMPGRLRAQTILRFQSDRREVANATVSINGIQAVYCGNGLYEVSLPIWGLRSELLTTIERRGFSPISLETRPYALGNFMVLLSLVVGLTGLTLLIKKLRVS